MNENDLRDLLPDERSLPSSRRRDMQERLMAQIEQEEKTSRNHFRLVVGAAAAALVAVIAAAAVVAGTREDAEKPPVMSPAPVDRTFPDPEEVARAETGPGVDMGIYSEQLACFTFAPPPSWDEDGDGAAEELRRYERVQPETRAEPVTVEMMTDVCRSRLVAFDEPPPDVTTEVCVRRSDMAVTVGLEGATCSDIAAGDGRAWRLLTDADLAKINHLRAIEYALLANPQDCPEATAEQTAEWAQAVLDQEGLDLPIEVHDQPELEPGPPESPSYNTLPCPFFAKVDWAEDVVSVVRFMG